MHTRQLQQYTQYNYNNAHKTTTTIHTIQLQQYTQDNSQYTQDNYNNTQIQLTTIHTRQNTTCTKGKQHQRKKVLYTVSSMLNKYLLSVQGSLLSTLAI